MHRAIIDPGWAWTRKYRVVVGQRIGQTVYLSGLVALDGAGNLVGGDDVYQQSMQVFRNIEQALQSVGGSLADLVRITTYLTDMDTYADFSRARADTFPEGPPASTAVATPALVMPELRVEIEATAVLAS